MNPIQWALDKVVQPLIDTSGAVAGWVWSVASRVLEWCLGFLIEAASGLRDVLFMLLPAEAVTWLESQPWDSYLGFFEDIAWLIPVYPMMGVAISAFTIAGTIRLLRYALGIRIFGFSGGT